MSLESISTTLTRVDPTYRYHYHHPISHEKTYLTEDQISYLELINTHICNQNFPTCAYFHYYLSTFLELTSYSNELIEARDFILHSILCIPTSYTSSESFLKLASTFSLHFDFSISEEELCSSNDIEPQIGWQVVFQFDGICNGKLGTQEIESPPFFSFLQSLNHAIYWIESCQESDPVCYRHLHILLQQLILESWEIKSSREPY